ncbi:MAG: pimeloyl-ACP methyl ester carboxylesterase, partial [Myxococcota bacterium]
LAGLDAAEDTLRDWMGAPAQYSMERVSSGDGTAPGGPVVVLVHGLDSRAENLRAAASALAARGYDAYLYSYPDDGRIERAADHLGRRTREIRKRTGRTASLITTSMGGVIARIYLELDPTYESEITTFIACNPPFQGSWMANYHELWELAESTVDLVTQGLAGSPVHDGLGQASTQLLPNSTLMLKLRQADRRAGVRYSILAGAAPVADPALLDAADILVAAARPADNAPWAHLALDLTAELIETARQHGHHGDGAVILANQTLRGVTDRVVRSDIHHLAALSPGKDGKIYWLKEILERLPPVR